MGVSLALAEHSPRNALMDLVHWSSLPRRFCVLESPPVVWGVIGTPESVCFHIGSEWRFSRNIRGSETLNLPTILGVAEYFLSSVFFIRNNVLLN